MNWFKTSSNNKKKVILCLILNYMIAFLVTIFVIIFRDSNGKYFRFGPHDDLIIISVLINTWIKWTGAILLIGIVKGCEVLVNELGLPILDFRVYNPDYKVITDFRKNELNFLTNAMWFVNNFRAVLMTVVSITQIDLAFAGMIISEIVSIFTVRILLNEKKFAKEGEIEVEREGEIEVERERESLFNNIDIV